ncbi:MAG: PEP-utilizing enzyme [Candidatus Izemoplasmatales bacterium]|nr:PEP-utilizing enzyme [Candidatus Izemoplasmatales bacterium]
MLSFQGIGATNGKGSGVAIIHKKPSVRSHEKFYELEAKELFYEMKELALAEIDSLIEICHNCEEKDILIAHKLILDDPDVNDQIFNEIEKGEDIVKAIKTVQSNYFNQFKAMENEVFSSKALDVEDVFERLVNNIKKQVKFKTINKSFVLVCDDLLPTTIYDYPLNHLKAIVVKQGSLFSHGVIIAKSKNIPVVIGLGFDFAKIKTGDYLVVDGLTGKVVLISE